MRFGATTRAIIGSSNITAPVAFGHALIEFGRVDEAAQNYGSALALLRELGLLNVGTAPQATPYAGLARVALASGNIDGALVHVETILTHFGSGGSSAPLEPLRDYLICYQVLAAAQDPRTDALLATMHAMLEDRARTTIDAEERRMFRENIPYHREIVAAWLKRERSVTED